VNQLLEQPDPRLVQLLIVDSSAWVGVSGVSTETPIRGLATFYITGWSTSGRGGDPCDSVANGTSSNGLAYTADDSTNGQSNVLLGHFVQPVLPGSKGTGTGQQCVQNTLGNCIAILTK
jgi:hypothetical protein